MANSRSVVDLFRPLLFLLLWISCHTSPARLASNFHCVSCRGGLSITRYGHADAELPRHHVEARVEASEAHTLFFSSSPSAVTVVTVWPLRRRHETLPAETSEVGTAPRNCCGRGNPAVESGCRSHTGLLPAGQVPRSSENPPQIPADPYSRVSP
ncbi:hypothetical protein GGR56DRAFT_561031 [Xylariaceae sp. FL0804]|nr:hypothetical protein GGR56DRAFT_561031 [Xylariaceae sp. FL0804]